jgi:hypothetical protein
LCSCEALKGGMGLRCCVFKLEVCFFGYYESEWFGVVHWSGGAVVESFFFFVKTIGFRW